MKDVVIKGKTIRRELIILALCLVAMILVNAGAIIAYHRPWTELFTQIGYVLTGALILYILLWIPRLIVLLIVWLTKR